jgi:hypothetical protein
MLAGHLAALAVEHDERRGATPARAARRRNVYGGRSAALTGALVMDAP